MKKIILILLLVIVFSCNEKRVYPLNNENVTSCELIIFAGTDKKEYPSFSIKEPKEWIPILFNKEEEVDVPSTANGKLVFHTTNGTQEVLLQKGYFCILKSNNANKKPRFFTSTTEIHDKIFELVKQYIDETDLSSIMNYKIGLFIVNYFSYSDKEKKKKGIQLLKNYEQHADLNDDEKTKVKNSIEFWENN